MLAWVVLASLAAAENGSGTISGTVRLVGAPPPIPRVAHAQDLEVCGGESRSSQSLRLGTNQVVMDAIVYLEAAASRELPAVGASPGLLEARDCELVPRVQFARDGTPRLIIKNNDPLFYALRVESLNGTNAVRPMLTVAAPYAGYERSCELGSFGRPTLLRVTESNGHPWMIAYIAVLPHPWADLTDEAGTFKLQNVPAGVRKLCVWHEVLGTLVRQIKVNGGRATNVDLEFTSTTRK